MTYQNNLIQVTKLETNIAIVTLNNPPLNLVTLDMSAELRNAMQFIDLDHDVRVVILTGSGTRAFCVGSDIKEFPMVWDDVIGKKLQNENLTFDAIEFLSKPVIAAMEGNTLGGGCEMSMACDLRIMSEDGRIGLPEINLGVFPGSGGLFRLSRLVGVSKAMELMYTGEVIGAHEALTIGLVSHIAPATKTLNSALSIARIIASKPRDAIAHIKKGVRALLNHSTEECFYPNLDFSRTIFQTSDCAEGVDAFLNKRKPNFR